MLCSRLPRSTYAQPGRGRERTAFASRVSTCKQNGLAHERLRYPKPSLVVVLDFRSWKTSSGDLSVIIDVDDQLLRSNSPLAMLHVDAGELRRVHAAQGLSSHRQREQEGWCPCCLHWWLNVSWTYARPPSESGIPYENITSQVMAISSVDDEEKCQVWKMKEKSLPRETAPAPQPTTHVHLRSVACHRAIAVGFWQRHFVFK